jgi:hypothetical protein
MTRSHGLTKENLLLSQALEERKTKTGRQKSNVKLGHLKKECRGKKKDPPIPSRLATAAIADYGAVNNERSFYFTFGQMHDKEDNISHHERCCNITLASTPGATSTLVTKIGLPADQNSIQPTTEIIFDTGAIGSIVANEAILASITRCEPSEYNGLSGSLTVTQTGQLRDIGIVHFDKLSILSASDSLRQGHQWEFRSGRHIDDDVFLLHTRNSTYSFKHRDGLSVADTAIPPDPRYLDAPRGRNSNSNLAIVCKQEATMLYSAKLPTATFNEALYLKREVQRSIEARRLQASLGFPPDSKFIAALNAGSFLNCTVIAADVRRATAIWGLQVAALKGKPMPPPQEPATRRLFVEQHIHCDIKYISKKPVLVSRTEPIGVVLCACLEKYQHRY